MQGKFYKFTLAFIAILTFVFVYTSPIRADPSNDIPNPGFDKGIKHWYLSPDAGIKPADCKVPGHETCIVWKLRVEAEPRHADICSDISTLDEGERFIFIAGQFRFFHNGGDLRLVLRLWDKTWQQLPTMTIFKLKQRTDGTWHNNRVWAMPPKETAHWRYCLEYEVRAGENMKLQFDDALARPSTKLQ